METKTTDHGFCHGADMDPVQIRRRWPGARFVARAQIRGGAGDSPDATGPERPWGVLLALPGVGETVAGQEARVRTDEGREVAAMVLTTPDDLTDPVETIRWARYWELSPTYVTGLAAASGQPVLIEEG